MTIGIIGSRTRDTQKDYEIVADKFFELYRSGDSIVSGGCPKGGDRFAEKIALEFAIPIKIQYPDWPNWSRWGKYTGFTRNSLIANDSDILIACVHQDRKGDTEDTIRKYLKLRKMSLYRV